MIERFVMDARTRRAVAAFDRDGVFSPGEYVFRPPSVTQRLGAHKKYKNAEKGGGGRHGGDGPPRLSMLGVRNGKGKRSEPSRIDATLEVVNAVTDLSEK